MDVTQYCFICQDFSINTGHSAYWCPKVICKKCGKKGHAKIKCMINLENFPLPDEIVLKIFSYLSVYDLAKCSQVSKRWKNICHDNQLGYNQIKVGSF